MDMTFARRLHELRHENNLTTKKLSELIGFPRGVISHWEAGDFYPSNERAIVIADYFDVSLDYLFGRTDCKASISSLCPTDEDILNLNEFTHEQKELIKSLVRQIKK